MTTPKQLNGNTAPDGSLYITLTDGNGNLVSSGGGSGSMTVGTSTISGGTSGNLLYDNAGVLGETAVYPTAAPAAGKIPVGNAGGTAYAPVSVSGDASLSSTGALTVTKTNGAAFATSATTDTTNAANITSGTVNSARLGVSAAAGNGATFSTGPSDPTGTTSSSGVMMGLGSTCKLTPTYSSRIHVSFIGDTTNSSATVTSQYIIRYGSGTPPTNGTAQTGFTAITANYQIAYIPAASASVPFTLTGIVTGLTPGTQYWFDIGILAPAGGTASVKNLSFVAYEF